MKFLYSFTSYGPVAYSPYILTFQVAVRRTANKLQTKKNVMLQDHKVNINYNMNFFK